ncbi:MAG: polyphenol oxidase family protein [Coriobacteriia bacterium]|nr:polyphenol oxidase family protein [Coriobacteriia bacterium]
MAVSLPLPTLEQHASTGISILTDDALASSVGIFLGFTGRAGGVSTGAYAGLNLATHVGDEPALVCANRQLLLDALGVPQAPLIVPNQVHGTELVTLCNSEASAVELAKQDAAAGADGLVVSAAGVVALLCFADCLPLVLAAPGGQFAVVHAGWRGAVAGIAGKALQQLCAVAACAPDQVNAYIGPHIRSECFETGEEVAQAFQQRFGVDCVPCARHVSLAAAVAADLQQQGANPARIADAQVCTRCNPADYYSYRATGGTCGRHGAFAAKL